MKNNTIYFKFKLSSVMIALCLVLSSCSFFKSDPVLVIDYQDSMGIPKIENIDNSETVNAKLNEYFTKIIECLEVANHDGADSFMVYSVYLKESGDKKDKPDIYALENKICVEKEYYYSLPDILIYTDGKYVIPTPPSYEALRDGEFVNAAVKLKSYGLNVDLNLYNNDLSVSKGTELFIEAWEYMSGQPVDYSKIASSIQANDIQFKKALELGITNYESIDYYSNAESLWDNFIEERTFLTLTNKANNELFGRYSETVSLDELKTILYNFMLGYIQTESDEFCKEVNAKWLEVCNSLNFNAVTEGEFDDVSRLSRGNIAKVFVDLYEQAFGKINVYDTNQYVEYNKAVSKAIDKNLMNPLFGNDFAESFEPNLNMVYEDINSFTYEFKYSFLLKYFGDVSEEKAVLKTLYDGTVKKVYSFIEQFDGLEKFDGEKTIVNNTRDYNWYYTQNDESEYAYVNCMPAITCMALKWCNENVTVMPDDLRKLYPDNTEGWYMYMVENCLDKYGITYEAKEISMDAVLEELDKGNIILTQNSEKDWAESGHCMVIYGYEKFNNSTVFYVHDSDVLSGKNIYDKYYGEDMRLEANYALLTMERFTIEFLSISDSTLKY